MKKLLIFSIVAAFLIGNLSSAFAASQKRMDSSSLSNSNTLINNIEAGSVLPVGTVITWPSGIGPQGWSADINNTDWLECNGSPIPAHYTELIGIVGANTPNYAGMFLRGRGGKAGALGVKQDGAVHLPASAGAKMRISGISRGAYVESITEWRDSSEISSYSFSFERPLKFRPASQTGEVPLGSDNGWHGFTYANGIGAGGSLESSFTVNSPAQETRPDNVAVIYYIKAR